MNKTLSILPLATLFGCVAIPPAPEMPPFEGISSLDQRLKQEGYSTAYASARASGCSEIDRVVVGGFPLFAPTQTLVMTESWVLHGCEDTYRFRINVSGNGVGGTIVDVQEDF